MTRTSSRRLTSPAPSETRHDKSTDDLVLSSARRCWAWLRRRDMVSSGSAIRQRTISRPEPQRGPVAQRLEQGTHNPLVLGSNPSGPIELQRCAARGSGGGSSDRSVALISERHRGVTGVNVAGSAPRGRTGSCPARKRTSGRSSQRSPPRAAELLRCCFNPFAYPTRIFGKASRSRCSGWLNRTSPAKGRASNACGDNVASGLVRRRRASDIPRPPGTAGCRASGRSRPFPPRRRRRRSRRRRRASHTRDGLVRRCGSRARSSAAP